MITYHNAIAQNGQIVHIDDVSKEKRDEHFYCAGCQSEMIPVLGDVREHHFRHKGKLCSKETYLHQLGKILLKEKFDTQKEFVIKYYGNLCCNKTENCKLLSIGNNIKCNHKVLLSRDLKKDYDTCEVEVTYNGYRADLILYSKEHPNLNPLFIEISVTHDCEQAKIHSDIQIIEIKIDNEEDLSLPLVEEDNMLLQLGNDNPYEFYESLPHVRFYNFQRQVDKERPLDRFWVSKDEKGYLRGNTKWYDLNCKKVDNSHRDDSLFEVAIPSEIIHDDGSKPDLYSFGMAKAIHAGISVKECSFCLRYNFCTITIQKTDKNAKKEVQEKIKINQVNDKKIDKVALAHNCKLYSPNDIFISRVLNYYQRLPCWEWKKSED